MVAGDGVLIWKSRDKAGIYAIAEIIESPKIINNPPDIGYWIDTSRIGTKPCANPISYALNLPESILDKFAPSAQGRAVSLETAHMWR